MRLRFFINSKILKIIFVAICFFIYSFIVVKPARAWGWDNYFVETESEGDEKTVSYKDLIKGEKVPAYVYIGCDPIKNGFSCVGDNQRCILYSSVQNNLNGQNIPYLTGVKKNTFVGKTKQPDSTGWEEIDNVFTCNGSGNTWNLLEYDSLHTFITNMWYPEIFGADMFYNNEGLTHYYGGREPDIGDYDLLFRKITEPLRGVDLEDLKKNFSYTFKVYPIPVTNVDKLPPTDCGSNYDRRNVDSKMIVCMRKDMLKLTGLKTCDSTGNTFCSISYGSYTADTESYDVKGQCVVGDICHKLYTDQSYCSPSNNEVNLYSGATCISQSINPAIYNTKRTEQIYDLLLGLYACGSDLSLQNATESGDGYFIMCEKGTHCVANNGSRGSFFNTFYGDVPNSGNTGQNLPSVGSCFGLNKCILDVEVYGKTCSTNSLGPNPYNFIDNCCHPEFFCKPNHPGSSTAGTCQTKNFEVCTEERTSETKLNVSPTEFIMPGEICKYGSDEDYCVQCSTSTTFEDGSNKRCGQVVTQIDPVLGSEITINCKSDCACPLDKKCDLGKCVLNDECTSEGEACSAEKRCCNSGQYSCKSNPSSDDGSSTCELNCENPGVTCNPNDPIRNACCLDKYCGSNGRCVISNRCNGKNEDECCGYNSKCDASGDCIQAPDGDVCKTDTILSKDPIKRPTKSMNLYELLTSITAILYPLAIILGMGYLIMGGYKLMSSQGSPEAVKGAQEMISSAIIGMVFIILSATILRFVLELLIEVSL